MIALIDGDVLFYMAMWEAESKEHARENFDSLFTSITESLFVDDYAMAIGNNEGSNFRYDIYNLYKTNRTKSKSERPEVAEKIIAQIPDTTTKGKEKTDGVKNMPGKVTQGVITKTNLYVKLDKKVDKRNSLEEDNFAKSLFVGTPSTTPNINEINPKFPLPSLFLRLIIPSILFVIASFFLMMIGFNDIGGFGIMLFGNFAIPLSVLTLFFELNIRKNIPIWTVLRIGLLGGFISFFFTLIFHGFTGLSGAWSAAITEEPAKLIALIFLTRGGGKYPYILNGLLLGAAIGCCFSAFESVQYALDPRFEISIIFLRAALAPFTHIVWTALAGAALWRVQRGDEFRFDLMQKMEFLVPFGIVILLHMIWNSFAYALVPGFSFGGNILLGVIAWIMVLFFVNLGIQQIANEQKGKEVFVNGR